MKLQQAFEVVRGDVVAFIGAGGKTSTLIGMGYELCDSNWRILATTTTAIEEEQLNLIPAALHHDSSPEMISATLSEHGFVFLYDSIRNGKVYGPSRQWTKQILDTVDSDVLLVEADGASGLPFKAPYEDEPVIPVEASLVIPIASMGVLDKPLDDEHVYNSQAMIDKYGFYPGSNVRSPWIAQILRDEEFGLRGIPDTSRVIAFINQTPDSGYLRGRARLIARMALKSPRFDGVAIGSIRATNPVLEVQRPIGAIVLANDAPTSANESQDPSAIQNEKSSVEKIVDQLFKSRLDNIQVISSFKSEILKKNLKSADVKVIHNRAFKLGDVLSSIRVGLRAMPEQMSAALIVIGDQAHIPPKLIYTMLKMYSEGKGDFIVPTYQTLRGYPILVARRYWSEVLDSKQTTSLHDFCTTHKENITFLPVETDRILSKENSLAHY